jgi:hypothetical protein
MNAALPSADQINSAGDFFVKLGQSNLALSAAFFFVVAFVAWLFFGRTNEWFRVFAFVTIVVSAGAILFVVLPNLQSGAAVDAASDGATTDPKPDLNSPSMVPATLATGEGPQPYVPEGEIVDTIQHDKDGGEVVPETPPPNDTNP